MTTEFTPHPWKVLEIAGSDGVYGVYADAENAFVAQTLSGPNEEANAHLIAAAPKLYEALERILRAHDSGNNGAVMGEAVLCRAFAEQALAALAKARGEQ